MIIVFFLWALTAIHASTIRKGIVGSNGVEPLNIMALFISLAYLSVSLDKTGLFGFLAVWVARKGKSSGRRLFLLLYIFFFACSVLFGNDPVILSGTPFLAHFTAYSQIDPPTAWIFSQFIPANTASAILPPSNPTNLVVTSAFSISFLSFAAHTVIPTLIVAVALYILLRYVQYNNPRLIPPTFSLGDLKPAVERRADVELEEIAAEQTEAQTGQVPPPEERELGKLTDRNGAIFGSILFITTLVVLLGTSVKHIPVWWVTVPAAVIMIARDIFHDRWRWSRRGRAELRGAHLAHPAANNIFQRLFFPFKYRFKHTFPTLTKVLGGLPVLMLPFAFSMFILVEALTESGWIQVFSKWWAAYVKACGPEDSLRALVGAIFGMLIISTLMCNFCGTNIGATIFLAQIIAFWVDNANTSDSPVDERLRIGSIYALALGTNFGAYSFVFSASLAGLLWKGILKNNSINKIVVRKRDFAIQNLPSILVAITVSAIALFVEVIVAVKH
ncbi:hypothetical protein SCHPADRAFT_916557 [Schizopora paradoxa]|uniref:Citrate transporter-like domain-containing protein n=1 Tax=Schizopora paradoxa TaxID=27342 RepID=A0A0H2RYN0_9AGAM|nr:hypothetical protein SCHPADRAFT_916557 [Schizopora paradoxa]